MRQAEAQAGLLIRRSLVRAQVGEPDTKSLAAMRGFSTSTCRARRVIRGRYAIKYRCRGV